MPLQTGEVLAERYRIVKLLGQGGFGAVYRAWDLHLKRPYALKENLDTAEEARRQFEREARILASLHHPNLPRVINHFIIPNQGQYLVMDFVDGEDLEQVLKRLGGPIPEEQAISWVEQICDALEYLHSQNPPIIHRDIKPANIKITPEGRAILVDFGIAKIYDDHLRTTVGAQAVTPGYSPFEQYGQGATDDRTDVYALGATLYTLLTCQTPPESIMRANQDSLTPAKDLNKVISPHVDAALLQAMSLHPTGRYPRIGDFKFALRQPGAVEQTRESPSLGGKRWVLISVLILSCFLLSIGGYRLSLWISDNPNNLAYLNIFSNRDKPIPTKTPDDVPEPTLAITENQSDSTDMVEESASDTPEGVQKPTETPSPTETSASSPTPTISSTPTETLPPTIPPAFEWNTELILKSQDVGYFTSLVIDNLDNLHVCFYQDSGDILLYGHNDSGQWLYDYVVGGSGNGFHPSLTLDSKGIPHIAYHVWTENQTPEVRYVTWNGTIWNLYRLYGSYASDALLSLDLDADDQPHIAYLDGYTANVTYVPFTSSGWDFQTVDRANETSKAVSMVVDAFKKPHISYQGSDGILKYATLEGGVWQRFIVDSNNGSGQFSDITLDSDQRPHIAYYDDGIHALKYAYFNGESWLTTMVDNSANVGEYPSIAVDRDGNIHISYYDASNTNLKYANGRDGQWDIYTVDDFGEIGKWDSLALDSNGIPYITYLDMDNVDLKLAKAFPATR